MNTDKRTVVSPLVTSISDSSWAMSDDCCRLISVDREALQAPPASQDFQGLRLALEGDVRTPLGLAQDLDRVARRATAMLTQTLPSMPWGQELTRRRWSKTDCCRRGGDAHRQPHDPMRGLPSSLDP